MLVKFITRAVLLALLQSVSPANACKSLGFVNDSTGSIWFIDLLKSPPALSNQGANPIHTGIHPQELAIGAAPASGYFKVVASQGMAPMCDFGNRPGG
jgi:hypothetical protein